MENPLQISTKGSDKNQKATSSFESNPRFSSEKYDGVFEVPREFGTMLGLQGNGGERTSSSRQSNKDALDSDGNNLVHILPMLGEPGTILYVLRRATTNGILRIMLGIEELEKLIGEAPPELETQLPRNTLNQTIGGYSQHIPNFRSTKRKLFVDLYMFEDLYYVELFIVRVLFVKEKAEQLFNVKKMKCPTFGHCSNTTFSDLKYSQQPARSSFVQYTDNIPVCKIRRRDFSEQVFGYSLGNIALRIFSDGFIFSDKFRDDTANEDSTIRRVFRSNRFYLDTSDALSDDGDVSDIGEGATRKVRVLSDTHLEPQKRNSKDGKAQPGRNYIIVMRQWQIVYYRNLR